MMGTSSTRRLVSTFCLLMIARTGVAQSSSLETKIREDTDLSEINAKQPAICNEGSVNYCKDLLSAEACGKLYYCQLIWNPPLGYKVIKDGNHYSILKSNIGFFHVG